MDNKTNEFASWDFDLLANEIEGLDFEDYDFGFETNVDIDFTDDDFLKDTEITKSKTKTVVCPECGHEFKL